MSDDWFSLNVANARRNIAEKAPRIARAYARALGAGLPQDVPCPFNADETVLVEAFNEGRKEAFGGPRTASADAHARSREGLRPSGASEALAPTPRGRPSTVSFADRSQPPEREDE